jgi:hypothetical protein
VDFLEQLGHARGRSRSSAEPVPVLVMMLRRAPSPPGPWRTGAACRKSTLFQRRSCCAPPRDRSGRCRRRGQRARGTYRPVHGWSGCRSEQPGRAGERPWCGSSWPRSGRPCGCCRAFWPELPLASRTAQINGHLLEPVLGVRTVSRSTKNLATLSRSSEPRSSLRSALAPATTRLVRLSTRRRSLSSHERCWRRSATVSTPASLARSWRRSGLAAVQFGVALLPAKLPAVVAAAAVKALLHVAAHAAVELRVALLVRLRLGQPVEVLVGRVDGGVQRVVRVQQLLERRLIFGVQANKPAGDVDELLPRGQARRLAVTSGTLMSPSMRWNSLSVSA